MNVTGVQTCALPILMYGFGKTRVTLFMNFCRIFLFRVPVLMLLQRFTDYGSESAGIVMGVSNFLSGVLALVLGAITFAQVKGAVRQQCGKAA